MSTKVLGKPFMPPSLLDDMFTPWSEFFGKGLTNERMLTMPPVNVVEKTDKYLVSLAVPGFKKEDLTIDVEGNMLTVSSEKEETKKEVDEMYSRNEYRFQSFSRSFTIPEDVKQDNIEAQYEDGILKIRLPRKEEMGKSSLHKTIPVK
jgi:HSP20 family protein